MILALWVGTATLTLTACSKKDPPASPPVGVSTVTVTPRAATVAEDYVAATEALNTVEIRPRVGGVLEKQVPIEGEGLTVGEVLLVIDQQPYIAALVQAQAALAQGQAALIQSQRDLGRAKSLSELDAVSQQELDAAVAKNDVNRALSRSVLRWTTRSICCTRGSSRGCRWHGAADLRLVAPLLALAFASLAHGAVKNGVLFVDVSAWLGQLP